MQSRRGKSISVIGAIDTWKGLTHYSIFEGSNSKITFKTFLEGLIGAIDKDTCTIVLDNLPIHHSKMVEELVKRTKHKLLFLPPYSCALNPIETLWSLVKREWRQLLLEHRSKVLSE